MAAAGPWNDYAPGTGAAPGDGSTAAPAAAAAGPWNDYAPGTGVSTGEDLAKSVASGAIQGVTSLPAAPTSIGDWLARAPGKLFGMTDEDFARINAENAAKQSQTPAGRIHQAIDPGKVAGAVSAGLTPDLYQPQTEVGKWGQIAGTMVPGALVGEAGVLPTTGRLITQAAIPATGAYVGGKVAPSFGLSPETGQVIGGVLGGGAGAAAVPAGKAAVRGTLWPLVGDPGKISSELQEAITNAPSQYPGAPAKAPYIPTGAATTQAGPQVASTIVGSGMLPGAEAGQQILARRSLNSIGDYAAGLNRAAGASNPTSAGEALINKMAGWFTGDSKQVVKDGYDAVQASPTIRQQPSNVGTTLQQLRAQRANAGYDLNTGLDTLDAALATPNGLDYAGTKLQRTAFRTNTPTGLLPGEYEKLYDAWTQDLNSVAAANGPDVLAQHQVANDLALSVGNRRKAIGKILGMQDQPGAQPTVSPDQMFGRVQSYATQGPTANIDKLKQIKGTVGGGQEWQEFAGTVGQQLGLDANGKFDLPTFFRNYNNLSDEGKNLLFGTPTTPGFRNAYDTIGAYGSRGDVLTRQAGPQTVAPHIVAGVEALAGLWFKPLETIAGIGGGMTLMGLLGRPATAASVARWAKTGQALSMAQRAGNATPAMMRNFYGATRNLQNTAAAAGIPLPANLGDQGGQQ